MKNKLCRFCRTGKNIDVVDFGNLPIAHHLRQNPDDQEYRHPLAITICESCGIAGIVNPCPPEKLYLDYNYNFSSWKAEPHMPHEIDMILKGLMGMPGSVFEIGCNDGSFISRFSDDRTTTRIGLEPNPFPAGAARKKGVTVINAFLNKTVIDKVVTEKGKFDLVVARQVLEHLLDFELFFQCLDDLLSDSGCVFIDIPDSENGFSQGDCSIIWDEHVTYFCENSLIRLFRSNGYEPLELRKFNFSGGILSCLFQRKWTKNKNAEKIDISGFVDLSTAYSKKIKAYGEQLKKLITRCRQENFSIAVYGVGCRGTMLVNALKLGHMIDLALDDQAERQGKYMPGTGIQIFKGEKLVDHDKMLIILAVGQENDEKVKAKIKSLSGRKKSIVVSACSPASISGEVDAALAQLGQY